MSVVKNPATELFIMEVQSNAVLYLPSDPNYLNAKKKETAWEEISRKIGRDGEHQISQCLLPS